MEIIGIWGGMDTIGNGDYGDEGVCTVCSESPKHSLHINSLSLSIIYQTLSDNLFDYKINKQMVSKFKPLFPYNASCSLMIECSCLSQ